MPYEIKWHLPGEVLHIDMQNGLSIDDMKSINQQTLDILNQSARKLILLLDVSLLNAGYSTVEHLRNTQLYRNHWQLDALVVIANTKLNRLVTLLAFHLSRAPFVQFDDIEQAQLYISNRKKVLQE